MKSKYETHVLPNLEKIKEWAAAGVTAKEIADNLNIAYSTFRKYLDEGEAGDDRYSALSAAFTQACVHADAHVENALYKSALGYNAKVMKHYKVKEVHFDDEGRRISETERLEEIYDEVHVPASVSAQQFWLTNRQSERWKYKPEVTSESDGEGGVVIMPPPLDNPGPPKVEENDG